MIWYADEKKSVNLLEKIIDTISDFFKTEYLTHAYMLYILRVVSGTS